MDGQPYSAARFAATFRRQIYKGMIHLLLIDLVRFLSVCNLDIQNILVSSHHKTQMTLGQKLPMPCARHPSPMMTQLIRAKIGLWLTPCLMPRTRCGITQRDRIVRFIRRSSVPCQPILCRTGGLIRYYLSCFCL